jgi:hypothetical protein
MKFHIKPFFKSFQMPLWRPCIWILPPAIELFFKNLLEVFLEQVFLPIIIFVFWKKKSGLIRVDFVQRVFYRIRKLSRGV